MKTIKNKLFLATAILALASCADNTYIGDQDINTSGNGGVISFNMGTPALTRAEKSGDNAALDLKYKFKVYATKTVGTGTSAVTSNVFASGAYPINLTEYNADNVAYWVWYNTGTGGGTTTNSNGWEYVGSKASTGESPTPTYGTENYKVALPADQTIKYWDNNAEKYEFVAYSATVDGATISKYQTTGFTVQATAAQLAGLYIADKKEIAKNTSEFGKEVKFTFRRAAAKVRLGIYEIIPGYQVRNVKFKYNNTESTTNAFLDGKFVGNRTDAQTFNVTYDATSKKPVLSFTGTAATYYDFGTFTTGTTTCLGESSNIPTWANANVTDHYINVLPNTVAGNIDKMTLTVDYQLYNSTTGETINITGATATVPAAYMEWKPNYAYTYLFKITDDKLTPITFDAVTIDDGEGKQETITTVTEPSITTFGVKNGAYSVGKNEYETGTDIYATITSNGTIADPTSKYFVYTATTSDATKLITEASVADAIAEKAIKGVTPVITCTSYTTNVSVVTSIPGEDGGTKTVVGAIKMQSPAAATYVVAYQQTAGSATATSADYNATSTYYSMTANTEGFYPKTTVDASDLNNGIWKDENAKAKYTTNPTQPVYIYKVIKVAAASANP